MIFTLAALMVSAVLAVGSTAPTSSQPQSAAAADIASLSVRATGSVWGLYEPGSRELVIEKRGAEYRAGDRVIATAAVERIVRDVERPPVTTPTLAGARIPEGLLASLQDACGSSARSPVVPAVKEGEQTRDALDAASLSPLRIALRELCVDRSAVDAALRRQQTWSSFHEGPRVLVDVRYADGRVVQASSTDETFLSLPWSITRDGVRSQDYDADLGFAVADVLPQGFSLRDRLIGSRSGQRLGWAIAASSQRYQRLEFATIFGDDALAAVDAALPNPTFSLGYGIAVSGHADGSSDTVTIPLAPQRGAASAIARAARDGLADLALIRRRSAVADRVPDVTLSVWRTLRGNEKAVTQHLEEVPAAMRGDARYETLRASIDRNVDAYLLDSRGASLGYAVVAPSGAALMVLDTPEDSAVSTTCSRKNGNATVWSCRSFADPRPSGSSG